MQFLKKKYIMNRSPHKRIDVSHFRVNLFGLNVTLLLTKSFPKRIILFSKFHWPHLL